MNDALDLTNAIEAAESAAGLIGLPGRAERAVRAAAPEVLRAAAERMARESHDRHIGVGWLRALANEIEGNRG